MIFPVQVLSTPKMQVNSFDTSLPSHRKALQEVPYRLPLLCAQLNVRSRGVLRRALFVPVAALLSATCSAVEQDTHEDPGIGTTFGPSEATHASVVCAGVLPCSAAMDLKRSTIAMLCLK